VSEEILVNVTPQETRVAFVENGVVQELQIERDRGRGIVGNIYKGRVVRILPGMQAAFIDIGLERSGFLHATDAHCARGEGLDDARTADERPIAELLHDGQEVLVQVLKDPLGTKGARLTTDLAIPARYLVMLPFSRHIGISQRIEDPADREKLRARLESVATAEGVGGGFVVRTAAESAPDESLSSDMRYLDRAWSRIRERALTSPAPSLLHADLPLALRILRDLAEGDVERVRIDSRETYERALEFVRELIPGAEPRIEPYSGERPLFDLYAVDDEIQRALERKVPLKSGGHLIIDQTEAMTTVDVNTGGFVGRRNLDETLFRTNLEAAQAIARQLRLRNLGGIIIIDFIDMVDPEQRRQVTRSLEKALARDRVKTFITEMSSLGLVEITRKRTRDSIEHLLCEPCPTCGGRGMIRSAQTVCYEIFRDVVRVARQFETAGYLVLAAEPVVDMLLDEESYGLAALQEFIGRPVHLQVETSYTQEQFDIVPV